jgi:hypothetical protein
MQVTGLVLTTDIQMIQYNVTHKTTVSKTVHMTPAVTTATSKTGSTSIRTAAVYTIFMTFNTAANVSCDAVL